MKKNCIICNLVETTDSISCEICKSSLHLHCAKIKKSDSKVVKSIKNFSYKCNKCCTVDLSNCYKKLDELCDHFSKSLSDIKKELHIQINNSSSSSDLGRLTRSKLIKNNAKLNEPLSSVTKKRNPALLKAKANNNTLSTSSSNKSKFLCSSPNLPPSRSSSISGRRSSESALPIKTSSAKSFLMDHPPPPPAVVNTLVKSVSADNIMSEINKPVLDVAAALTLDAVDVDSINDVAHNADDVFNEKANNSLCSQSAVMVNVEEDEGDFMDQTNHEDADVILSCMKNITNVRNFESGMNNHDIAGTSTMGDTANMNFKNSNNNSSSIISKPSITSNIINKNKNNVNSEIMKMKKNDEIIGSGKSELNAVTPTVWLHISKFKVDTEPDQLINHISSETKIPANLFKCFKLIKKGIALSDITHVNFKLSVPASSYNQLMSDSSIWPMYVKVKKFVNQSKNDEVRQTQNLT